ncbi:MAG: GntR family transcriptional regulator, partial [Armatimonadetes bacterium]|nr:GntR family transcriptional regulator [Candidatus Hippobium faecium]
ELAELFSVSRMTAREAITMLINQGLVKREHGKGSFVISNSPNKKEIILMLPGLVDPGADDYFYYQTNLSMTIISMQKTARRLGYNIKIVFSDFRESVEKENLVELVKHRPDALIINVLGDVNNQYLLKTLRDLDVFVVMIDIYDKNLCNGFCVSDNYGGTLKLLEHYCSEDTGKIELWTNDRQVSSIFDRIKAYRDFCNKKGIYDENLLHTVRFNSERDMQKVTEEFILSEKPELEKYDTVFFTTSSLFSGYISALQKLGIKPSKKYVCVDKAPDAEKYNLRYLEQNWSEIGTKAIEMIDDYFDGEKDINKEIFIDTKII